MVRVQEGDAAAAAAADPYAAWAPKEFDAAALEQAASAAAAGPEATADAPLAAAIPLVDGELNVTAAVLGTAVGEGSGSLDGTAQAGLGNEQTEGQAQPQTGFVYDSTSGGLPQLCAHPKMCPYMCA